MNNDNSTYHNEDTIDPRQILKLLKERSLFIFGFTGVTTLIVIGYLLSLTTPIPQYHIETSFLKPNKVTILKLKAYDEDISGGEVFGKLLVNLSSPVLQKRLLVDGNYLKRLQKRNVVIADVDVYASKFIKSITVEFDKRKIITDFEVPHFLKTTTSHPDILSDFLNDLLNEANKQTINDYADINRFKTSNRLKVLNSERTDLIARSKQKRLNEIVKLKDAASLASSLSIVDSNLSQLNKGSINTNLNISIQSGINIPDWYLYGSTALLKMIETLEVRPSDEPYIPSLVRINSEILKLNTARLDMTEINAMQVYQSATSNLVSPITITNKRFSIILAFFVSLILSILIIFMMNALKEDGVTLVKKGM